MKMLGPIDDSAHEFPFNLGHQTALQSGDNREASFLFEQISVLIQRFNTVLLHAHLVDDPTI